MPQILKGSFLRSSAQPQAQLSLQGQAVLLATLEFVGCSLKAKESRFLLEVLLCPEEMAQALWVRDGGQEKGWAVVWEVGEWEGTALERVLAETAFAPVVGQRSPTRWAFPVTT